MALVAAPSQTQVALANTSSHLEVIFNTINSIGNRLVDKDKLVSLDSIAAHLNLRGASSLQICKRDFNRFAKASGLPSYRKLNQNPDLKKDHFKLAFAPAEHVLAFLRARKSDAAQALVAKIDAFLADQTREHHEEELDDAERAVFDA